MDKREIVANIIEDYCEGIEHLEFSRSNLSKMVQEIIESLSLREAYEAGVHSMEEGVDIKWTSFEEWLTSTKK